MSLISHAHPFCHLPQFAGRIIKHNIFYATEFIKLPKMLIVILLCLSHTQTMGKRIVKKINHVKLCTNPVGSTTIWSSYVDGTYLWDTGDTTRWIDVCKKGNYVCLAKNKRERIEEMFEVEEKHVSPPQVVTDVLICQGDPITGIYYTGMLWYTSHNQIPATGSPAPPDITKTCLSEIVLFAALKEGECFSDKIAITVNILDRLLCHPRKR